MANEAFRIDGPLITGLDASGDPLAGGKLYLFEANTTTPKASWQDEGKTAANAHPIILDSAGRGRAYIDGQYSVRMDDKDDVQVWAQAVVSDPTVSVNINNGGTPGDAIVSPLVTKGDLWTRDDNGDIRLPVGGDDLILTGESTEPAGPQYKKLQDIPLDPDAETPEYPSGGGGVGEAPVDGTPYSRQNAGWVSAGSGSGGGIIPPPTGGLAVGEVFTSLNTDGTAAADPVDAALLPGTKLLFNDGVTQVARTAAGVFEFSGSVGAIVRLLAGGGSSLDLDASNPAELAVSAVGAPLAISSDTAFSGIGGRTNSVSIDDFMMAPGVLAVGGTSLSASNTPADDGDFNVGVWDVNSASSPGPAYGGTVTGA